MELTKEEYLSILNRVLSLAEKAVEKPAAVPTFVPSQVIDPFVSAGDYDYPSPEPLGEAPREEVVKPKLSPFNVNRGFGRTRKPSGQGDAVEAEHELGGAGGLISTSEREALDSELWDEAIGDE